MMKALLASPLIASLVVSTGAIDLTTANWEEQTAGKTVFVKFFAPWCGHCKGMKPAWDKLMKNWNKGERVKTTLIADVDCTAETGKPLCDQNGVQGFPSIKWGDASSLEDYKGGRDYDALKKFAKENLKPLCSPMNLDLCDDEKKKTITEFQAMSAEELEKQIVDKKAEIKTAEETFEAEVKKLQDRYSELQKEKEEAVAGVKKSGLGLMQAVQAHAKKSAEKKEEL